jgi:hypothetical protein
LAVLEEGMTLTEKVTDACTDRGSWNKLCRLWNWLKPGDRIALVALIVACLSIALGAYQAYQADRVMHANIKPLLEIQYTNHSDQMSEVLFNYGLGPAEITDVQIHKNGINSRDMKDFIHLPYNAHYDSSHNFGSNICYVQNGQEIVLAEITRNRLKEQGYNDTQVQEIMKAWEENLSGVGLSIDYEDILGEKQDTVKGILTI